MSLVFCITGLHQQLVLLYTDGKALVGGDMLEGVVMLMVRPVLVTLAPMTRVQDHILPLSPIVQSNLIPPYLPKLRKHPVLVSTRIVAWEQLEWEEKTVNS